MTDEREKPESKARSVEDLVVIREIYDSDNAQEIFEIELERAIQSGCKTIIIEPTELGEETEQWITYGIYLHHTAIFSGLSSIFVGIYWNESKFLPLPLALGSCLCSSLYSLCWLFDPCSCYKIDKQSAMKRSSRKRQISTSSKDSLVIPPVVLIRETPTNTSKYSHLVIALASFSFCLWKLT